MVDIVDAGAPGMDFDRAHLYDFKQALHVFDVQVFVVLTFVPELERPDIRAQPFVGIPLVEALIANAGRASQQAERMAQQARHVGGDRGVVFCELAFCHLSGF